MRLVLDDVRVGLLSLMIEEHEGSGIYRPRIVLVSQAAPFAELRKGLVTLQRQKLDLTHQIHALRISHPLSWGSNYVTMCLADVSIPLS